jgi:hypothetical protein
MKSESLAGEMSFGCASRKKSDRGKLVALVGDNTGSLHGLAKGRSRVKDLNVICARMAARQILTDMEARWAWINSAAMPADYPSRIWIKKRRHQLYELGRKGGLQWWREHEHVHFRARPSRGRDPRQLSE